MRSAPGSEAAPSPAETRAGSPKEPGPAPRMATMQAEMCMELRR